MWRGYIQDPKSIPGMPFAAANTQRIFLWKYFDLDRTIYSNALQGDAEYTCTIAKRALANLTTFREQIGLKDFTRFSVQIAYANCKELDMCVAKGYDRKLIRIFSPECKVSFYLDAKWNAKLFHVWRSMKERITPDDADLSWSLLLGFFAERGIFVLTDSKNSFSETEGVSFYRLLGILSSLIREHDQIMFKQ